MNDALSCQATRRDGGRCRQRSRDDGRCHIHGGKETTASEARRPRPDRYSSSLSSSSRSHYEETSAAPEFLSVRREIALIDVLIEEHFKLMAAQQRHPDLVSKVRQLRNLAEQYPPAASPTFSAQLDDLYRFIVKHGDEVEVTTEVRRLLNLRARLVARETKRMVVFRRPGMSVELAAYSVRTIARLVQNHVEDEQTVRRIFAEFEEAWEQMLVSAREGQSSRTRR